MKTIGAQLALFWNGLKGLLGRMLGSRKMILDLIAWAVVLAKLLAPELAPQVDTVGLMLAAAILTFAQGAGIELGDVVKAWKEKPTTTLAALAALQADLEALKQASAQNATPQTPASYPPPVLLPGADG